MSLENYTVAVKLSLVENVSKGLVAIAGQFATLNQAAELFNDQLSNLKSQIALGASITRMGASIATPLLNAAIQGGRLEQQMRLVQITTRATIGEMESLHKKISDVAMGSIFDVTTVATIARVLATAGNFTPKALEALVPKFTNYAQTQKLVKGTSYETSVDQAIKLAEITGNFSPNAIQGSLNALNKLSLLMPGSVDKVLGAFKYMQGTMKNVMGMSDENSLTLVAFMQRMGIEGTKAGSQLLAFMTRAIPQVFGSGLWEGKSLESLSKMGMLDERGVPKMFTDGKADPMKLFKGISDYVAKTMGRLPEDQARSEIMKTLAQTFGVNGTRQAAMFINNDAMAMYGEIQKLYKSFPNLDELMNRTSNIFVAQFQQAGSGMSTLFQNLGLTVLPQVTFQLRIFNEVLKHLDDWIVSHKNAVAMIGVGMEVLAAALVLGGSFMLLRAGFTSLMIPFRILTVLVTTLIPAFTASLTALSIPMVLTTAAVIACGFALYKLYQNWEDINNYIQGTFIFIFLKNAFYGLSYVVYHALHPLQTMIDMIKSIGDYFTAPLPKPKGGADFLGLPLNGGEDKFWSVVAPGVGRGAGAGSFGNVRPSQSSNVNQTVNVNGGAQGGMAQNQPIHIQLNLDGKKISSSVMNHVVRQATNVPSSGSQFDGNLSLVPTIVN